MKKLFHVVLLAVISFASMPLAASENIGLTVGVDYVSKKKWRGVPVFDGLIDGEIFPVEGAFLPFVSYNVMDTGLSLEIRGKFAESYIIDGNKTHRGGNSTDFNLDYSNKFGLVTLGAGAWYFRYWDNNRTYSDVYVSLELTDIFLSPVIIYTQDYYFDTKYWKDFYLQIGISHSFDIVTDIVYLKLAAIAGYFNRQSDKVRGISDIDLSAELNAKSGAITYSAGFHYVIVPLKAFYRSSGQVDWSYPDNPKSVKDRNRFHAAFGVSYTF